MPENSGRTTAFYRTPAGPPLPRSPISAVPPCFPDWGARTQPGLGQRALHEPAASAQPCPGALIAPGDAPGKVTRLPLPAAPATATECEESPWRRRSSFEPVMPELPLNLDDADLPVSLV
ncbi:hypothetical protein WMY93_031723 [Mugilogobius chulae]|uniref:Uncharacterized protein n=1 Tax=Mugilogobius chulae TaxID=88201 RepID=A0AAW0MFM7_9GOBI